MNLKVSLSANGIQKLIDGVNQYRQDLHTKVETMVANLAAEGANIARSECPIQTGQLYSSIVDEAHGTKAFIKVNCPYAVYVEMGTGIRGKNAPHPDKTVIGFDFEYDRNNHGEGGWWYPTDASDPNPTKYTAKDGTMYAWTAGMPSRPFMYNTAQQLKDKLR